MKKFVYTLQDVSLFPPVLCKSYNQILLALKARFPGDSQSFSLVLLFSSVWVTHPVGMGFDFIMMASFLAFHCAFFFVFGRGVAFLGGF